MNNYQVLSENGVAWSLSYYIYGLFGLRRSKGSSVKLAENKPKVHNNFSNVC